MYILKTMNSAKLMQNSLRTLSWAFILHVALYRKYRLEHEYVCAFINKVHWGKMHDKIIHYMYLLGFYMQNCETVN